MHIQLMRPWRGWRAGHVFTEFPPGAGRLLIRRGIGMVVTPPSDTAASSTSRRTKKKAALASK